VESTTKEHKFSPAFADRLGSLVTDSARRIAAAGSPGKDCRFLFLQTRIFLF
jgi:hypothetical protein